MSHPETAPDFYFWIPSQILFKNSNFPTDCMNSYWNSSKISLRFSSRKHTRFSSIIPDFFKDSSERWTTIMVYLLQAFQHKNVSMDYSNSSSRISCSLCFMFFSETPTRFSPCVAFGILPEFYPKYFTKDFFINIKSDFSRIFYTAYLYRNF